MNNFLDRIWNLVEIFLGKFVSIAAALISPLEVLGPAAVIFLLTFLVVVFSKTISRFYVTRRYVALKNEFEHWRGIREEAMKHPDKDKAKTLAKNIDQAKLNRVYYDYFFEGLLKNLVTQILPILLMAALVTRLYTPQTLLSRFDREWVFSFAGGSGAPINVSSLLWFVISLILSYILYILLHKLVKKKHAEKNAV